MVKKKQPAKKEVVASASVITGRTQAEEALQVERDRAQQYLDIAGVILVCLAPDQTITLINRKGCELLGYAQKELIGKNWFDMVLPEDERQKVKAVFTRLMEGELEPDEYVENYVRTRSGERRLISWHNTMVRDPAGNITGTLSSGEDITDRKQSEEKLSELGAYNRSLIEASIDSLVTLDHTGKISDVNAATAQITGVPRQDLIGSDFSDYFTEPQKAREGYRRVFEDGSVRDYPLEIRHRDGHITEVLYNASVYRDKSGKVRGVFAAARDVTERKRLEEEQQKVAKLESIGVLAAGIAHNFNNILTVILGNIDIAKMDANPGSETHEVLDQAEKASLRAKDLTAQLLTFAKGGAPLRKITSLAELIKDTANSALHGSNVKCHFSIPADLRQAEIDAVQVKLVIYNLVINARQATPAGGTIELLAENMPVSTTNGTVKELMLKAGDYVMIGINAKNSC
jgi:PAS domain S-box-containing protein